jgi:hypothetical protein
MKHRFNIIVFKILSYLVSGKREDTMTASKCIVSVTNYYNEHTKYQSKLNYLIKNGYVVEYEIEFKGPIESGMQISIFIDGSPLKLKCIKINFKGLWLLNQLEIKNKRKR